MTPPRPTGPTEAQRKIEELTRQLEEEIEQSEEQGEYFGKLLNTCCYPQHYFADCSYFQVFAIRVVIK